MKIEKCKICGGTSNHIFSVELMRKYDVGYFLCVGCSFLQTEEPFWLKEAYMSPINLTDTGLLARNIYFSRIVSSIFYFVFGGGGKYLDYAGGYGVFVRLMRDAGFDYYWQDPFSQNIFARGFEYDRASMKIDAVTSFEAFEHFSDPLAEIEKMLEISKNIFFSTQLLPKRVPAPCDWWYYGLEHGQHISFYSVATLEYIAKKYGLNFYTNFSDFHFFTEKKLNSFFVKFLIRFSRYIFELIVKKKMTSLTYSDLSVLNKKNK